MLLKGYRITEKEEVQGDADDAKDAEDDGGGFVPRTFLLASKEEDKGEDREDKADNGHIRGNAEAGAGKGGDAVRVGVLDEIPQFDDDIILNGKNKP